MTKTKARLNRTRGEQQLDALTVGLEVLDTLRDKHGVVLARILDHMDLSDDAYVEASDTLSAMRDQLVGTLNYGK